MTSRATTLLLERDAERAALAQRLEAARAGRGSSVHVRGPAGIGKTALLAEASELAADAGLRVLSARGTELDGSFAFGAVRQLFDEPAGESQDTLHRLYWRAADLAPLAILVDDAHWLDRPSLRWLAYLAGRVAELPIALVVAGEAEGALPGALVLTPPPLSAGGVRALAEHVLGRPPGDDFVRAAAEATHGNPFHLRMLLAEGEGAAPVAVADHVALRLGRLPEPCTRLARALAVLDGAASGTVAARLARLDVRDTVAAAEALAEAGLVPDGAFAHPLLRAAVYAAIAPAERAELHARAARLLADAGAPPERVAAQVAAGEPGGEWAVQALRRAARAARARGAGDVAAGLLRRAREEDMPPALRIDVLRELAPAIDGRDGLPYLYEALGLAPGPEIARELARALARQGLFSDAATILEREAPGAPELAEAGICDLGVLRRLGGLEAIKANAPESVRAWIEVACGPVSDGTADLMALTAAGRLEEAEAAWTEIADAAREAGALERLRQAVVSRALVRVRLGRVADVEADLREVLAWGDELGVPRPDAHVELPWLAAPLLDALVERGAMDEAQEWLADTGLEGECPELLGYSFLLDSLGRLRLAQGRVQEAVRLLRECSRRQRAWGIRNPGFIPWRSSLALALARTGRRGEALELCDEEITFAREFGVAREEGIALRALAEVTGGAEAVPLLREAVAVLERSPARLEHARALGDLAAATGESPREAFAIAVELGATALARRQPGMAPPPRLALTAAELRVGALADEGLSTRAIAERLFVTQQAVEDHLARARGAD